MDAVGAIEYGIIEPHVGHLVEIETWDGRGIALYCHTCQEEIFFYPTPEGDEGDYFTEAVEV